MMADVGLCVVHVYHHIILYRVQSVVLYGAYHVESMLTEYCMLTSSRGIDCTTAISPREGAHPNSESLQVLQPFDDFTSTRRKRKRKKSHC